MLKAMTAGALALAWMLVAAPATADEAVDAAELRSAMQALDVAFENQDEAAIRSLSAEGHIAIAPTYGGAVDLEEQFARFADIQYTSYDTTDPTIEFLDPRTAITNYRVALDGTARGVPLASPVFVTEIWVKRDGKWLQKLYQETPIDSP